MHRHESHLSNGNKKGRELVLRKNKRTTEENMIKIKIHCSFNDFLYTDLYFNGEKNGFRTEQ